MNEGRLEIALSVHSVEQLRLIEPLLANRSHRAPDESSGGSNPARRVCADVVNQLATLREENPDLPLSRIYFGCETCERRIPTAAALVTALAVARHHGLRLTLVTPYVSDMGLQRLSLLFATLADQADATDEVEVVVNDLGVLHSLAGHPAPIRPVLGRLLSKIVPLLRVREKEIAGWDELSLAGVRSNALCTPEYRDLVVRYGVRRVEHSVYPQGVAMPLSELGFAGSLYYPWIYVSSTRICEFASLAEPVERKFKVDSGCRRECESRFLTLSRPGADRETYFSSGRALVAVCRRSLAHIVAGLGNGMDRVILCPFLPE